MACRPRGWIVADPALDSNHAAAPLTLACAGCSAMDLILRVAKQACWAHLGIGRVARTAYYVCTKQDSQLCTQPVD
eukprot:scaffold191948_cov35-Tisochrysis_lutea.AAC.2